MELIGAKVKHNVWINSLGVGTIIAVGSDRMEVEFPSGVKTIQYPDAFEKAICALDPEIQAAMLKLIEEKRKKPIPPPPPPPPPPKPSTKIDKLPPGYHGENMAREPILTYAQVEQQFGIKVTGFGRGCNPTSNSVVLISVIKKAAGSAFVYHDRWTVEGDYIFSGEGQKGDQKLTMRNLEIMNAARNGKPIHLFIKFSSEEYYYQGVFEVVEWTYEDDEDVEGNVRKEYKFRLRKVAGQ